MKRGERPLPASDEFPITHALAFPWQPVTFLCDTTLRNGLNFSGSTSGCWIWACAKILKGPTRVEEEMSLRAAVAADPISLWGKLKRQILRQFFVLHESFDCRSTRIWSEIYSALWNCWFIAIWDFSFWGESDLWTSDLWPAMDGVVFLLAEVSHDEAKIKDLL